MALGVKQTGIAILGKVEEIDFLDIKSITAQRHADLLLGQGITIKSKNETLKNKLNEWAKHVELDTFLQELAKNVMVHGGMVATLDKYEDGTIWPSMTTPEQMLQNIENIEITPFHAVITKKKTLGKRIFYMRETWTTYDVKRDLRITDGLTQIDTQGEKIEIPAEFKLPEYERHNLGFIPFQEFKNKPSRNNAYINFNNWTQLADDHDARFMAISINYALRQNFKEKWKGATRVFGDIDASVMDKLIESGAVPPIMVDDYILQANRTQNQAKPVETLPATYDANKWLDGIEREINIYEVAQGYSTLFQKATEQTEAETLLSKNNDERTTKNKRRRWTEMLNTFIAKLVVYWNDAATLDEAKKLFTIEIKETVVYNQLQLVEFIGAAIEKGLMTRLEAIMLQRDIDNEADAQVILDEIEKDQEAINENLAAQMEAMGNEPTPGEGQGAMGNGGEADPKE